MEGGEMARTFHCFIEHRYRSQNKIAAFPSILLKRHMQVQKTILITGANNGIGLATAQLLAAKGHTILTLCRDKSKGDQTVTNLKQAYPGIQPENFTADLTDFDAVQKAAQEIVAKYPVIDRLINNAGYYAGAIEYSGNVEKTLKASHLGHMLLTQLLLPSLNRSSEARIINVSSALHAQGSADRFFKRTQGMSFSQAYSDAKLANVLFTLGLTKHLPSNIKTFVLHPGVVRTGFANNSSGWFSTIIKILKPFFLSPEQGAATSVYLADVNMEEISSLNGHYFAKKKATPLRHKDVTEQKAAWLWSNSMEFLKPYLKITSV